MLAAGTSMHASGGQTTLKPSHKPVKCIFAFRICLSSTTVIRKTIFLSWSLKVVRPADLELVYVT